MLGLKGGGSCGQNRALLLHHDRHTATPLRFQGRRLLLRKLSCCSAFRPFPAKFFATAVDRPPSSSWAVSPYNGAGAGVVALEHEPRSSFREATTSSSLRSDGGFAAKLPARRRLADLVVRALTQLRKRRIHIGIGESFYQKDNFP
jgi:hypothetical protein